MGKRSWQVCSLKVGKTADNKENAGTMPLYMHSKPMLIHDDIMIDDEGDNVTELVGAVEQGEQEFEFDDCSEDENDGSIDDKDDDGDDVSCDESESES